jgi:hypothetical protein
LQLLHVIDDQNTHYVEGNLTRFFAISQFAVRGERRDAAEFFNPFLWTAKGALWNKFELISM